MPERPDHSEEIRKAAEAGAERMRREKEKREAMKQEKKDTLKRDRASMNEQLEAKQEERQKKKAFRTFKKQQDQEIAADKLRREKQASMILAAQQERDAERKEKQKYMNELHENARIKQAIEHQKVVLKEQMEKERAQAEHDYRRDVELAERSCAVKKEQAEKDARSKKSVEAGNLKTKLYQEEGHHRAKSNTLDTELRRSSAITFNSPLERDRALDMLRTQIRVKKKKIEDEHRENVEQCEREARMKNDDIDAIMYTRKAQADTELRQAMQSLDAKLARRYNDIEISYRKRLGEVKP